MRRFIPRKEIAEKIEHLYKEIGTLLKELKKENGALHHARIRASGMRQKAFNLEGEG